jgi:hypothetical protein
MNFIFIDETGDVGKEGGTSYFGYGLLHVKDDKYFLIRQLLSEIRWLHGVFGDLSRITSKTENNTVMGILRALSSLSRENHIICTGLYINKSNYGGRYLEWSETAIPQSQMAYRLRNYLLRHLLEFHFSHKDVPKTATDIILDRVALSEPQYMETFKYLNSKLPLEKPFALPEITHLTIADNEYICGLELAHVLADVVKKTAEAKLSDKYSEFVDFIRITEFIGHKKEDFGL